MSPVSATDTLEIFFTASIPSPVFQLKPPVGKTSISDDQISELPAELTILIQQPIRLIGLLCIQGVLRFTFPQNVLLKASVLDLIFGCRNVDLKISSKSFPEINFSNSKAFMAWGKTFLQDLSLLIYSLLCIQNILQRLHVIPAFFYPLLFYWLLYFWIICFIKPISISAYLTAVSYLENFHTVL